MRLIEKQEKTHSLDHYEGETESGDIAYAAELLYEILNASYACSGTCLSVEINGQGETVQSLYWKCKELMEQTGKYPEKTGFLTMSALEQTWRQAKPLCLLPVDALMEENGTGIVDKAKTLEQLLEHNEYKAIWKEKSDGYLALLDRMGFTTGSLDFSDLTLVMDPLLSALSFYGARTGRNAPGISKIRDGRPSDAKSPTIATAMCLYRSEKEFADAVMGSGKDAMLAFGAVEKTHRQVKNYFHEYLYGTPDERQRNFMSHQHITAEEYLESPCDYTRKVMLAVKDGQQLYLVHMPWKGDTYSHPGQKDSEYAYGKRASYAPYQIFYKEAAIAPKGTTMLAIPKNGYLLSDLMDDLSKAWFPAFIEETISYFFKNRDSIKSETVFLPEEITAEGPDEKDASYQIVPVWSGVPSIVSYTYRIPEPKDVFIDREIPEGIVRPYDASAREAEANKTALWFTDYFHITSKELEGAPILPSTMGTKEECENYMDDLVEKAYVKAICDHMKEVTKKRWETRSWCLHKIMDNEFRIIQKALDGDFDGFTLAEVAGTPIFASNGKPELEYSRKAGGYVQKTLSIDSGAAKEHPNLFTILSHKVLWASPATASKPAVVMHVRPETPEQYASLLGVKEDELPEMLRLSGWAAKLVKLFDPWIPNSLTNTFIASGYGDREEPCILIPCMAPVNICMNKKTWTAARPPKKTKETEDDNRTE